VSHAAGGVIVTPPLVVKRHNLPLTGKGMASLAAEANVDQVLCRSKQKRLSERKERVGEKKTKKKEDHSLAPLGEAGSRDYGGIVSKKKKDRRQFQSLRNDN